MKTNIFKTWERIIACIIIIMMIAASAAFLTSCKGKKNSGGSNETENSVRAADPMTDEEIEADDTDGCIEDSEDLLY